MRIKLGLCALWKTPVAYYNDGSCRSQWFGLPEKVVQKNMAPPKFQGYMTGGGLFGEKASELCNRRALVSVWLWFTLVKTAAFLLHNSLTLVFISRRTQLGNGAESLPLPTLRVNGRQVAEETCWTFVEVEFWIWNESEFLFWFTCFNICKFFSCRRLVQNADWRKDLYIGI